jgi:hypothetical protein
MVHRKNSTSPTVNGNGKTSQAANEIGYWNLHQILFAKLGASCQLWNRMASTENEMAGAVNTVARVKYDEHQELDMAADRYRARRAAYSIKKLSCR